MHVCRPGLSGLGYLLAVRPAENGELVSRQVRELRPVGESDDGESGGQEGPCR